MFVTQALHGLQIPIALYGVHASYIAVGDLRAYEATSEKAAKYSGEAERQLHKTRTTQATGAICIFVSLAAAVTLATAPGSLPAWAKYAVSPAMLVATLFARAHVSNFWTGKAKVPFVDGYNEAISKTGELVKILEYLEYSWVVTSLVSGLLG